MSTRMFRQHGRCSTGAGQLHRSMHLPASCRHSMYNAWRQHGQQRAMAIMGAGIGPAKPYTAPNLQTASILLLLFESYKRAHSRPLVEGVTDLVQVPQLLWGLKCCILVLMQQQQQEPSNWMDQWQPSVQAAAQESSAACSSGPGLVVAYANAAAQELLSASEPSCSLGGTPVVNLMPDLHPSISSQVLPELPPGAKPAAEVVRGLQMQTAGGQHISTDCVVCDVASPSGAVLGRAVMFESWEYEDGRVGRAFLQPLLKDQVPGPAQLAAAEAAVRMQADAVRALKSGRGNQDSEVQAAVAELQARKAALATVEEWAAWSVPQYLHALEAAASGPEEAPGTDMNAQQ